MGEHLPDRLQKIAAAFVVTRRGNLKSALSIEADRLDWTAVLTATTPGHEDLFRDGAILQSEYDDINSVDGFRRESPHWSLEYSGAKLMRRLTIYRWLDQLHMPEKTRSRAIHCLWLTSHATGAGRTLEVAQIDRHEASYYIDRVSIINE